MSRLRERKKKKKVLPQRNAELQCHQLGQGYQCIAERQHIKGLFNCWLIAERRVWHYHGESVMSHWCSQRKLPLVREVAQVSRVKESETHRSADCRSDDGFSTLSSSSLPLLFAGPISSVLVNRYGSRPVVIAGGLMCGLSIMAASFGNSIVFLYLCISVIGGNFFFFLSFFGKHYQSKVWTSSHTIFFFFQSLQLSTPKLQCQ